MKKTFLLLLVITIFICGCARTGKPEKNIDSNIDMIPFLFFSNNSDTTVSAKLAFWDPVKGNITFTNELVYTASTTEANTDVEVITWDGDKEMLLQKNSIPSSAYSKEAEINKYYDLNTYLGRNIKVKLNWDDNPDPVNKKITSYDLTLKTEEGPIQKRMKFSFKTQDLGQEIIVGEGDHLACVDFDNKTGVIRLIYRNIFEENPRMYIASCNINDTEAIKWDFIEDPKKLELYFLSPSDIEMIDNKIYAQCFRSLAEIDIKGKNVSRLDDVAKVSKSIVKEGSFDPGFPKDILPIGSHKGTLLIKLPVSTDVDLEYLVCAFNDGVFLGAIHLKNDDTWDLYDHEKEMISTIDLEKYKPYKSFGSVVIQFPSLQALI